MSVDPASFRRAMGQFATGVTVVTTRDASGQPLGLTVSAFCSVSLEPPLVLVCIDHRSQANRGLRAQFFLDLAVYHLEDFLRSAEPAANATIVHGRPKKTHGWQPMSSADLVREMADHVASADGLGARGPQMPRRFQRKGFTTRTVP